MRVWLLYISARVLCVCIFQARSASYTCCLTNNTPSDFIQSLHRLESFSATTLKDIRRRVHRTCTLLDTRLAIPAVCFAYSLSVLFALCCPHRAVAYVMHSCCVVFFVCSSIKPFQIYLHVLHSFAVLPILCTL